MRAEELDHHEDLSYEQVEHALVTGLLHEKVREQDGLTRTDPKIYSVAVSGDHNKGSVEKHQRSVPVASGSRRVRVG